MENAFYHLKCNDCGVSHVITGKYTYVDSSTHFYLLQGIDKQPEIYAGGSVW